ncbi:methyl farnesoate epoxidase [Folsomia candida]|uniref:Methyl farnesoate epoxidase n=1 Tax=Folsomia candida TaxID=158441 RepID=A0A226DW04_FOLCA|nr:methyl farnesoate epoxidase [Folsomia candida]OXA48871.1 Methyl farnesoate epoxidase [Folsomia candida]
MDPFLVTVTLFVGVILILFYLANKPRNSRYPKGPLRFPLLGNIPQLLWGRVVDKKQRQEIYQEYSKIYGPVFSTKFGPTINSVILNDPKVIKEAWNKFELCGRPKLHGTAARTGGTIRGILFQDGSEWMEQRRFTIRQLRSFGFGKRSMEHLVMDEVTELADTLRKDATAGVAVSTQKMFNAAVLNSLWRIMTGQRFSHDDKELDRILDSIQKSLTAPAGLSFVFLFPIIKTIAPNLSGWNEYLKEMLEATNFIRKFVTKRLKNPTVTDSQEAEDFTDVYIKEIKETTDKESSFYQNRGEETLMATLLDLFVAGAETTSTTLTYFFLYMALFPEKQEKLQKEIDAVVGTRHPTLEDRTRMPYTEATIMETLRFSSMVPLGLIHRAMEDTELAGFLIPKNTFLTANLYNVHHSPEIWGDPANFRPERFLSPDATQVVKNDALMPFSWGKRLCLGEQLAKDELFLFVTTLLQEFGVHEDPSSPEPLTTEQVSANIINPPKPHKLLFKLRKN